MPGAGASISARESMRVSTGSFEGSSAPREEEAAARRRKSGKRGSVNLRGAAEGCKFKFKCDFKWG
jgi:hypothetical protein